MKITQEQITVVAERHQREVAVIMAGLRITLSEDEAKLLANGLDRALTKLGGSNGASVESPAAARPFQTSKEKPDLSSGEADPPLKDAIDEIASTLNGMFKRGGTGG